MRHYRGEAGAEHMVRKELPCGEVQYFKGKRGAVHLASIGRKEPRRAQG